MPVLFSTTTMSLERIPLDRFLEKFSDTTELSSVSLGARIISVSDEFFAEAYHLLLVEPAPSMKGQFGPNGALFSGWETRRHNPSYDWCILQLGTSGTVVGFDVDTSNFNGNEAPQVSIEILNALPSEVPRVDDFRWKEVLPRVDLGPNSRHLFKVPASASVNFVKLNMYPDGGIARFRVYGHVSPVYLSDISSAFDLAHVFSGGRVVYVSDQHFGVGSNLLLPGRGVNMGDGWETKRSREKGHKDWVIIKLGTPGVLEQVEIDTAHFKGNYPESCEMGALFAENEVDWSTQKDEELSWTPVLSRIKLGSHRQHYFQLENVDGRMYTHVKVTIHPDGGIKRIRIIGRRIARNPHTNIPAELTSEVSSRTTILSAAAKVVTVPVLPLTPEAFAAFGQVVQAYEDHAAVPKGIKVTSANGGTATKFHKLSLLDANYPQGSGATSGISVYRCKPLEDISADGTVDLTVLERHPFTNQAFLPMGHGGGEGVGDPGDGYLVVVAQNSADDRPDMQTLRAFRATTAQGIVYKTGIWHQPMTVLRKGLDLACVETQIGDGRAADCEILELDQREIAYRLKI